MGFSGVAEAAAARAATETAADEIERNLPQAVDRLTPDGEVPSASPEDLVRRQSV